MTLENIQKKAEEEFDDIFKRHLEENFIHPETYKVLRKYHSTKVALTFVDGKRNAQIPLIKS